MSLRWMRRATGGVLAGAALSMAGASCGSGGLPSSGTFTFSWKSYSSLTQPLPYTGTIAGIPVTGSAENPARFLNPLAQGGGSQAHPPKSLQIARWSGPFESNRFVVSVSVQGLSSALTGQNLSAITFQAKGTYGSQPVNATVAAPDISSPTVHFTGTIGTRHLQGTLTIPNAHGTTGTAHGTFTLTG